MYGYVTASYMYMIVLIILIGSYRAITIYNHINSCFVSIGRDIFQLSDHTAYDIIISLLKNWK